MVNLEALSDANLDILAEKCGIKLIELHRARKIEEIKNAGIDPKKLEETFNKYAIRCIICGKIETLRVNLYYCEKCKLYYCINCLEKRESNDAYASYSKTFLKCRKGHYLGSDWI